MPKQNKRSKYAFLSSCISEEETEIETVEIETKNLSWY